MLIWLVFGVVSATQQQTLTPPTMAVGIPSYPGGIMVALENGDYLTVTVDDLSCGDFGTRVFWDVTSTDGRNWGGCYGSMDDAAIDWEWSENSLDSISGVYGIDARAMLHDAVLAVHIAA